MHEIRVIAIPCHEISYYAGYNNESAVEVKRNAKGILNVNKIHAKFFKIEMYVLLLFQLLMDICTMNLCEI